MGCGHGALVIREENIWRAAPINAVSVRRILASVMDHYHSWQYPRGDVGGNNCHHFVVKDANQLSVPEPPCLSVARIHPNGVAVPITPKQGHIPERGIFAIARISAQDKQREAFYM